MCPIIRKAPANVLVIEPDDTKVEKTLKSLKLLYTGEHLRVETAEEALLLLDQPHKFSIVTFKDCVWSVGQAIALLQVN